MNTSPCKPFVIHSPECRPAGRPYLENGCWWVEKAKCVCHLSNSRLPEYWQLVYSSKAPPSCVDS
ncbi:DUF5447 family protein [Azotobacter chroococcum]|uniref:DUF5447 family protein n=1 Tax=Azotobacter chroococcum TaxID=353 RepID=UPI0022207CC8|nr:DUF5447 family protein [Azotobacter chroococcum]